MVLYLFFVLKFINMVLSKRRRKIGRRCSCPLNIVVSSKEWITSSRRELMHERSDNTTRKNDKKIK